MVRGPGHVVGVDAFHDERDTEGVEPLANENLAQMKLVENGLPCESVRAYINTASTRPHVVRAEFARYLIGTPFSSRHIDSEELEVLDTFFFNGGGQSDCCQSGHKERREVHCAKSEKDAEGYWKNAC